MSEQLHRHCDCRNYAPVDVVKGICHRTKELVMGDDAQCDQFALLSKCRFCSHFTAAKEEFMGTCGAEPARPWTYPDLVTVTCSSFKR
jgi:4-hydroxyphenylacetate decarboxylase small subunit